jgi:hypothetical protein
MSLFRSPSRSISARGTSVSSRGGSLSGRAVPAVIRGGLLARIPIVLAAVGAITAIGAPAAQASFGVARFFAGNCIVNTCGSGPENPTLPESEAQAYRQAGGYVPYGITDITFNSVRVGSASIPEGRVKKIRVDVGPGVVTNPFAVPRCSTQDFTSEEAPVPGSGFFAESTCPERSIVGRQIATVVVEPVHGVFVNVPLEGVVYNLEPGTGLASEFGVALNLTGIGLPGLYAHTLIEGSVEWASDYHDYFEINNISEALPLLESRLIFFGNREGGEAEPEHTSKFIRNPTSCNPPGPATTSTVSVESHEGQSASKAYEGLVGANNCGVLPFAPSFGLGGETALSDAPDGITAETKATHPESPAVPDASDLKNATVTLPPGMTMNPSAARGLEACTEAQFGIHTRRAVACPSGSKIGTATIEVPTLPPDSLSGPIYLGNPGGGTITHPPYTVYLDAESARFGVKVRLEGAVEPNPTTGQLTVRFNNNPEAPFTNVTMHFNGGEFAPIANPLGCGTGATRSEFTPWSLTAPVIAESPFTTVGCASFAPTQSTSAIPNTAGAESNFTFTLVRPQGQQYVQQMSTTLPPGLVAKIPSVTQCSEAQANAGTCTEASLIGSVRVTAGSGEPYPFTGKVYLTEHYEGAPYGLSIVVPTAAGPFNFGNTVTRAKIEINPTTARVTVTVVKSFVQGATTSGLPTIVGGIPIRMRELTVSINRPNYILNPTNCSELQTETALTSTLEATYTAKSPFKVEGCSSLAFKPSFRASTSSHTSRANGASLSVNITQHPGGEANIGSVVTTLPLQLPSRLSTLNRACLLATFNANPVTCPAASKVGTASVVTPTLPNKMTGTAYIVSRGAEFPDLELVLEGDGVKIILDGQTHIKKGITTTTFASNPDVPISSFSLNLPMASNSLLAANGTFCRVPLYMPTTITGQNGKVFTQKTKISVSGCLPITQHRVRRHHVTVSVRIPQGGRVRFSGYDLGIITRFPRHARTVTVNLPLTPSGLFKLRRDHKLNSTVRVGFIPFLRGGAPFVSYANVTFR